MIGFLMKVLRDVSIDDWGQYVLAYDNMYIIYEKLITAYNIFGLLFCRCNVDRLKMLRKPLPLPEPFEDVWSKVTKIIGM